jgi:hypothetical protein
MATIRNFGFVALLKSEASNHIIRYRNGRVRQAGRGLVFWFRPATASIAEVPLDDREMTLFVKGRSQDFQTVSVQGTIGWHVVDPELLASRIDFSIGLFTGKPQGEPLERIEARITGIANQAALQYLAQAPVRALLDAGPEPLRSWLEAGTRRRRSRRSSRKPTRRRSSVVRWRSRKSARSPRTNWRPRPNSPGARNC